MALPQTAGGALGPSGSLLQPLGNNDLCFDFYTPDCFLGAMQLACFVVNYDKTTLPSSRYCLYPRASAPGNSASILRKRLLSHTL